MIATGHRNRDLVVVGAGPAGALAARTAARLGARVLLVDKARFPRPKVCGSCLSARALTTLRDAGLLDPIRRAGAISLARMRLSAAGRTATLPLPGGAVLSRARLDALLVREAVDAGVEFIDGAAASIGPIEGGRRLVTIRTMPPVTVGARVVIDATGLRRGTGCPRGPRAGLRIGVGCTVAAGHPPHPGTIAMSCGTGGYVGRVTQEDGRVDVAAALDPLFVRACGGPGPAAFRIVRESGGRISPEIASARWRGTPPLTQRAGRIAEDRLCRIGDAAGYVEPFTGEGIGWALAGGAAVAAPAVAATRDDAARRALPATWTATHAALLDDRHRVCRGLARLLRVPRLTAWAVLAVTAAPPLAGPIVRCAVGGDGR